MWCVSGSDLHHHLNVDMKILDPLNEKDRIFVGTFLTHWMWIYCEFGDLWDDISFEFFVFYGTTTFANQQ